MINCKMYLIFNNLLQIDGKENQFQEGAVEHFFVKNFYSLKYTKAVCTRLRNSKLDK